MNHRNLALLFIPGLSGCLDWSAPPAGEELQNKVDSPAVVGALGGDESVRFPPNPEESAGGQGGAPTQSGSESGHREMQGNSGADKEPGNIGGLNVPAERDDQGVGGDSGSLGAGSGGAGSGGAGSGGTGSGGAGSGGTGSGGAGSGGTGSGGAGSGGAGSGGTGSGGAGSGGTGSGGEGGRACERHVDCSDELPTCVEGTCQPFDCEAPLDPPLPDDSYSPGHSFMSLQTDGTRITGRLTPLGWHDHSPLQVCIVPGEGALDGSGGVCVQADEFHAFDFGVVTEFPVPFYLRVSNPDFFPTLRSVRFDPTRFNALDLSFTYVATRDVARLSTCAVERHLNPERGQIYVMAYEAESAILDPSEWVPLQDAEVIAVEGLRGGKAAYWNAALFPDPSLDRTSKTGIWLAGDVTPGQVEIRVEHPTRVCDQAVLLNSEQQAPGLSAFAVNAIPGALNGIVVLCRTDSEDEPRE